MVTVWSLRVALSLSLSDEMWLVAHVHLFREHAGPDRHITHASSTKPLGTETPGWALLLLTEDKRTGPIECRDFRGRADIR